MCRDRQVSSISDLRCSQHNYSGRRRDGHDPLQHLEAVQIGQVDVQQNAIRILFLDDLDAPLACKCRGDLVGIGQHNLQRVLGLWVIVDEQKACQVSLLTSMQTKSPA